MQLKFKKILAIVFITVFLSSIPLVFAESQPEYIKVVFDLRADSSDTKGSANAGGRGVTQGYILSGPKWKVLPVNIVVDSSMSIPSVDVQQAITAGAEAWDSNTNRDIFGSAALGTASVTDEGSAPDLKNEIVFGTFSDGKIIAQTTYWYTRRGEIVDFDIVFNSAYTWGDANVVATSMDFLNIATHELGHGFGLADLYNTQLSAQTMYGYASAGETNKRTLESGDIAGIQAIYGR
jgi:hypothetical protein